MRFLLELVHCCGSPTPPRRNAPGSPTPSPPDSEDDDNVRSLVTPLPRLQKRVRAASWSPSLGVISEEKTVTAGGGLLVGQRKVTASAGSVREGTGRWTSNGVRASDSDRRRRDRDEYVYGRRSYLTATMIPAFSPTPFVF